MCCSDPDGLYLQAQTLLEQRRGEAAEQRLLDQLASPRNGLRALLAALVGGRPALDRPIASDRPSDSQAMWRYT